MPRRRPVGQVARRHLGFRGSEKVHGRAGGCTPRSSPWASTTRSSTRATATTTSRPGSRRSAGGVLKQDVLTTTATELQLADVHFTILQKVFGYTGPSFGVGKSLVADILA
jgi:hypothetical protein